jgi:hypothetical protein
MEGDYRTSAENWGTSNFRRFNLLIQRMSFGRQWFYPDVAMETADRLG